MVILWSLLFAIISLLLGCVDTVISDLNNDIPITVEYTANGDTFDVDMDLNEDEIYQNSLMRRLEVISDDFLYFDRSNSRFYRDLNGENNYDHYYNLDHLRRLVAGFKDSTPIRTDKWVMIDRADAALGCVDENQCGLLARKSIVENAFGSSINNDNIEDINRRLVSLDTSWIRRNSMDDECDYSVDISAFTETHRGLLPSNQDDSSDYIDIPHQSMMSLCNERSCTPVVDSSVFQRRLGGAESSDEEEESEEDPEEESDDDESFRKGNTMIDKMRGDIQYFCDDSRENCCKERKNKNFFRTKKKQYPSCNDEKSKRQEAHLVLACGKNTEVSEDCIIMTIWQCDKKKHSCFRITDKNSVKSHTAIKESIKHDEYKTYGTLIACLPDKIPRPKGTGKGKGKGKGLTCKEPGRYWFCNNKGCQKPVDTSIKETLTSSLVKCPKASPDPQNNNGWKQMQGVKSEPKKCEVLHKPIGKSGETTPTKKPTKKTTKKTTKKPTKKPPKKPSKEPSKKPTTKTTKANGKPTSQSRSSNKRTEPLPTPAPTKAPTSDAIIHSCYGGLLVIVAWLIVIF